MSSFWRPTLCFEDRLSYSYHFKLCVGHSSRGLFQMVIFSMKVTHVWWLQLLDTINLCLKGSTEVQRVFRSPLQRSHLVKVIYHFPGLLKYHFYPNSEIKKCLECVPLDWLNVAFLYRYTPSMPLWKQCQHIEEDQYLEFDPNCFDEHGDACNFTNFLDLDWLSSSGNSCEEDVCDR